MYIENHIGLIMTLVYREADLDVTPKAMKLADTTHSSLGDAHGNTLKIIYTLIEEGILKLANEDDYLRLRDICKTPVQRSSKSQLSEKEHLDSIKQQIVEFKEILDRAEVNTKLSHSLMGDELCDRGPNDYYTLVLLDMLYQRGANIDTLFSNHGLEFLLDYERQQFTGQSKLGVGQSDSLYNMVLLIKKGVVKEEEVRTIVKRSYLPMLKAINYTLSPEGELTLFTHAPVGLETIKAVARLFQIPYNDQSIKGLITTIDNINALLRTNIGTNGLASSIPYELSTNFVPLSNPLFRLTWNRELDDELIIKPAGNFKVKFVHGHVGDQGLNLPSHENLDNLFGKYDDHYKTDKETKHFTRRSADFTAKQLADNPLILQDCSKNFYQREMRKYLTELKLTTTRLIGESEKNSNYQQAGEAATTLINALENATNAFFATEILTPKSFQTVNESVQHAIENAAIEFKNHHSWFETLGPVLKGILGVLALIPIGIPAIIVAHTSRTGYLDTFFGSPETRAFTSLQAYKASMDNFIKEKLDVEDKDPDSTLEI